MLYAPLIQNLKIHKTYSHFGVVRNGMKQGLFKKKPLLGKTTPDNARASLLAFGKRNLGPPQKIRMVSDKKDVSEWYGWRWKRALPTTHFTEEEWAEIERHEAHYNRRKALRKQAAGLWSRIKSRKLLISTALVLVFGIAAAKHFRPVEMWKVWREEGPSALYAFLKDPQTNQEKFMQAWSLYSVGRFEEAAQNVAPLLELKTSAKVKGDAFYLAGKLGERSNSSNVIDYFSRAAEVYVKNNALNSAFLAYVSLANFLTSRDDIGLADNYLRLAANLPASNPELGFFAEVEAKYFFRLGDFENALEASKRGLSYYEGRDINNFAQLLSTVAFYEILNGNLELGLSKSIECENLILAKGFQDLYFYNQINILLYHKCKGQKGAPYFNSIRQKIDTSGDLNLEWYLHFVQTYSCGSPSTHPGEEPQKVGEGEGPPPPPDNQ